jgi:hypothetical protein
MNTYETELLAIEESAKLLPAWVVFAICEIMEAEISWRNKANEVRVEKLAATQRPTLTIVKNAKGENDE